MGAVEMQGRERVVIVRMIENLTDAQLCHVPEGYRNNILWNVGHIVSSHQILLYQRAGLPMGVTEEFVAAFGRGSSPAEWSSTPDIEGVKSLVREQPAQLEDDFKSGRFTDYERYTTSTGIELRNWEDALAFNHFHEGVHTGVILAQKRLV